MIKSKHVINLKEITGNETAMHVKKNWQTPRFISSTTILRLVRLILVKHTDMCTSYNYYIKNHSVSYRKTLNNYNDNGSVC
jgi:hypothetical protein